MSDLLDDIGLANLTEEQLQALVTLHVHEDKRLDFKAEIDLSKDSKKRDLCKDISAFANTQGGWILVGVQEGPNSEAKAIVGVDLPDKFQEMVEQIAMSGVVPRIQHFDLRILPLANSKAVLIIKIERDGELHQVGYQDNRFYKRVHRTTVVMDPSDMRGFFVEGHPATDRREGLSDLRQRFEESAPGLLEGSDGIVALFVAPDTPPALLDLSSTDRKLLVNLPPIYSSGWDSRRHQTSVVTFSEGQESDLPRTQAEVFDTGIIQAADSSLLRTRDGKRLIPSVAFEKEIITSAHKYIHFLNDRKVELPIWIGVSLLNVRGYTMYVDPFKYSIAEEHDCREDSVTSSLLRIGSIDDVMTLEGVALTLKPAFDELWRAFNFDRSVNYDDQGRWAPS